MQPFLVLLATFLEQAKQKFIAASQAFAVDLLHALNSFGFDTDVMTINVLRRTFQVLVRLIHEVSSIQCLIAEHTINGEVFDELYLGL